MDLPLGIEAQAAKRASRTRNGELQISSNSKLMKNRFEKTDCARRIYESALVGKIRNCHNFINSIGASFPIQSIFIKAIGLLASGPLASVTGIGPERFAGSGE